LQSNCVGLLDNSTRTQSGENNQTDEANQQPVISKQVTIEKIYNKL
jgi:hypothetical protein